MEQAFSRYLAKAHSGFYSAQSPAQIKYTRSPPNIINRYRGARSAFFFLSILLFQPLVRSLVPSFVLPSSSLCRSFLLLPLLLLLLLVSFSLFLVDPLFRPNRNSITSHLFYACVIVVRVPSPANRRAMIRGENRPCSELTVVTLRINGRKRRW